MKHFITRLKLALLFSRHWPLCSPEEPEWTKADSAELARYFKTTSGQKLMELMRHKEQQTNSSAVLAQTRRDYTCGWASGLRGAFAWIYTLSQAGIESGYSGKSSDGDEDMADRYTP